MKQGTNDYTTSYIQLYFLVKYYFDIFKEKPVSQAVQREHVYVPILIIEFIPFNFTHNKLESRISGSSFGRYAIPPSCHFVIAFPTRIAILTGGPHFLNNEKLLQIATNAKVFNIQVKTNDYITAAFESSL